MVRAQDWESGHQQSTSNSVTSIRIEAPLYWWSRNTEADVILMVLNELTI